MKEIRIYGTFLLEISVFQGHADQSEAYPVGIPRSNSKGEEFYDSIQR